MCCRSGSLLSPQGLNGVGLQAESQGLGQLSLILILLLVTHPCHELSSVSVVIIVI